MCLVVLGWYFSFCMRTTVRESFNFSFPSVFSVNSLTLSNLKNTNYTVRREIRMAFLASRLPLLPCRLCLPVLEWGALYAVSVMELLLWICKKTVMWVNLKLSSFYCLVRQKVIFNAVPCVIHMYSAFSAAPSLCHLHPTWGVGSPPLANGKHTLKIMSTVFAGFQSNFFTDVHVKAYLFQLNFGFVV